MYQKTRNLKIVRKWIESHAAQPVVIKDTNILKLQFTDRHFFHYNPDDEVEPLSWQTFCSYFTKLNVVFLYEPDNNSAFYKFIMEPQPKS